MLIFICIALGVALRASGKLPEGTATLFNRLVIYVCLPAIVLQHIHAMDFSAIPLNQIAGPATMPWLLLLTAWMLIHFMGKKLGWTRDTQGALILTAGLGNTSFVGFPLIQSLYGAEGLQTAILVDQLGSFFAMSTLGIGLAIAYSGGTLKPAFLLKKVMRFPPFIALCVALLTQSIAYAQWFNVGLEYAGSALVPLALTAVGLQLRVNRAALITNRTELSIGLGYKLLFAPLLFMALYALYMDTSTMAYKVVVLEAAMAPMITAGIIASEYKLRGDLAALMVGIGIPISLFSVPLLNAILW